MFLTLRWLFGIGTATADTYADIISLVRGLDEYIDIPTAILRDGVLTPHQQRTLIAAAYRLFEMNRRLEDSIQALTVVFAALVVSREAQARSRLSINKILKTLRPSAQPPSPSAPSK